MHRAHPDERKDALGLALSQQLDRAVVVNRVARLKGGSVQENWSLDVLVDGAPAAWVLRTDAPSGLPASWGKAEEYRVLQFVHGAGLSVPEPIALLDETTTLGRPLYVMARRRGEARGAVLVRDPAVDRWGPAIVRELARELARLHRLPAPVAALDFMPCPERPAAARINDYRAYLADMAVTNPVLDYALDLLATCAPPTERLVLVHGDFRVGNVLVRDGALEATLDWEFASYSDPLEDVGWFLGRFWRFGCWHRGAGGLAPTEVFTETYVEETGAQLERRTLLFWQLLGAVRWAVIALQQAERCFVHGEEDLDLALTGTALPQLEWDILDLIEALDAA